MAIRFHFYVISSMLEEHLCFIKCNFCKKLNIINVSATVSENLVLGSNK